MRRILLLLLAAGVIVGSVAAFPYIREAITRIQVKDECSALAQSLGMSLMKEPTPDVSDERLNELLRQSGARDVNEQIERDKSGMPVDAWGHAFSATILYEGGNRYIEVRSAGPDGAFGTDDDCVYRGKL
jgi:hypothetical protein